MARIVVDLPDEIAQQLERGGWDLARRALEALVTDAYCSRHITAGQVQSILGLPSRWEADGLLKERSAYVTYDEADLAADLETLKRILPR